ncbi:MAG TPA: hypothetical protein VH814_12800 [Steroidobacteraceae bacterium]|jgi:hypothetical protein
MKHLQLKDCALMVGLNPEGNCVYSAAIALGDYWDAEHVWDSDKQVKTLKLQKVLGFLFGSKGNLLQQFESTFDIKTGVIKAGWARHEDGTVTKFGSPTSRSTRRRAKTRAAG